MSWNIASTHAALPGPGREGLDGFATSRVISNAKKMQMENQHVFGSETLGSHQQKRIRNHVTFGIHIDPWTKRLIYWGACLFMVTVSSPSRGVIPSRNKIANPGKTFYVRSKGQNISKQYLHVFTFIDAIQYDDMYVYSMQLYTFMYMSLKLPC